MTLDPRKLGAEFLGTLVLVVIAVGVATESFGFKLFGTSVAAGVVATAFAFGLVLLALALWDLRRARASETIAVIALLASALLFIVSFFPVAVACDYRYLYFLDVAVMAALLHRVSIWTGGARSR